MVVEGVWPLLHLQIVDEPINFHGNILYILVNAWQTQGVCCLGGLWPIPGAPGVTSLGWGPTPPANPRFAQCSGTET